MTKPCYATLTMIAALIIPIHLFSQNSLSDTILIEEVVVTGSKQIRSSGNVTQKIVSISETEIEAAVTGNNNLSEIIGQKAGLSISALSRNDANWGTYAGIGPKYSTYMLNGLPVDAFIDPMSLDFMSIERIEIQRGPASVLYPNFLSQDFAGNQSPLAGTVNLILKEKIERRKTRVLTSYGSYNTLNTQIYHQDVKPNTNYFAGANYETSDYTNYGTKESWLNMQKDPAYQKTKIFTGANFFYGPENKNRLNLFINKTLHKGDAGRIYRGFEHDYTTINVAQSAHISPTLTFNASAGMRIYDRWWQESQYGETDVLVSNNGAWQKIIPADAFLAWKSGEAQLFTIGMDYQNAQYQTTTDPLKGYSLYGNQSRAVQAGWYAQQELHWGNLTARTGLRYNYTRIIIDLISAGNPGEPENQYKNLLWSFGLKYYASPVLSLFANAGNSFLAPGLKSMGGTILLQDRGVEGKHGQLPNPDLKPESGTGLDLGIDFKPLSTLSFALRGYYIKVDDAIIENRVSESPSQSQSVNAGSTRSAGFEIEATHQLNQSFSWFANYTLMNTRINNPEDSDQDESEVPFAPAHVANAGLNIHTSLGTQINTSLNYSGNYYDSSSLSGRKKFTPGVILNLYIKQPITQTDAMNIDLFVKTYNLTNNKYEMPWQFQNTGRAVTAGFSVNFR